MQLGLVVGTATATARHPSMRGWKLLVVQPLMADGRRPDGDPQLAIDNLGAGVGESVMIIERRSRHASIAGHRRDAGAMERDWDSGWNRLKATG